MSNEYDMKFNDLQPLTDGFVVQSWLKLISQANFQDHYIPVETFNSAFSTGTYYGQCVCTSALCNANWFLLWIKKGTSFEKVHVLTKTTVELPISWPLGVCRNYCCRCPILNPWPILDSSLQTTRGMFFWIFRKTSKQVCLVSLRVLFILIVFFVTVPRVELKIGFYWVELSHAHYMCITSSCLQFLIIIEKLLFFTSYRLHTRALDYRAHAYQLDFPN